MSNTLTLSSDELISLITNVESILYNSINTETSNKDKRYNQYLNIIDADNLNLLTRIFNYNIDKCWQYNIMLYCILTNHYEILDFLLDNGFDINVYNVNYNIIYGIIKHNGTLEMIEHAIFRGALINPKIELYHPIISCILNNNIDYMNIISFFMNQPDFELNKIYNINNETLLILAVKFRYFDLAKIILTLYKQKYSVEETYNYVNHRSLLNLTCLEIAGTLENYDIIKFLLNNYAEIPVNKLLYMRSNIIKIHSYWSSKLNKNVIFLINKQITLNEFIQLIMIKSCNDFLTWNVDLLTSLYNLKYNHTIILKAIHKCCDNSMSHDIDSVSFLCKKIWEHQCASKIQSIVKKYILRIKSDIMRNNVMKIQKWYRHKYYSSVLYKENCSICLELLIKNKCYKFDCNHFCHINCFAQWRKEKNICPCCRNIVNLPVKC